MTRFIVEHPTRGVLKDLEDTESGNQTGRFTITGSRLQGMLFASPEAAFDALGQIRPDNLRLKCEVRREPTDAEVQSPNWREDAWRVVHSPVPVRPVDTVSPKAPSVSWKVAVLALGLVDEVALARKIGGRQRVTPLSISEVATLRRALWPFESLRSRLAEHAANQADAMASDLGAPS